MTRSISRRGALRFLAAGPIGAALAGCGSVMPGDGGARDTGRPDSGTTYDSGFDAGHDAGFDAGFDAGVCEPTTPDALGPFFEGGAPMRMVIATPDEPGERLLLQGSIVDVADCSRALAGYTVDIWQADASGNYYDAIPSGFRLRGRMITGADGRFAIETIKPGFYRTTTGPRPAHLHARVYAPDGGERLVTQLYFEGDAFLGRADGCQPPTCFSNDPARILRLEPARVGGVDGLRTALRLVVPR